MSGKKQRGLEAVAAASKPGNAVSRKPTPHSSPNGPPESSLFEIGYRDRLWRFALSTYNGHERLTVWQHYQDRETGHWKPCGGRCRCGAVRESPGFIVPPERFAELMDGLAAMQLQILPEERRKAA